MTSNEIRQQFLDFFKSKEHRIVPSSPVVPFDDPTLLFTNAGMNQFKDVFLGNGTREYKRAADTQKCIRVSGKHNDLEEVGYDTYHHTLFEMLGNWSFGDYYKKEAIIWAWELLTDVWKLSKERLWVTVYRTDDEAFSIWKNKTDINPDHILRFDEKDNFWEMGETGPCGPCSEIHINIGEDFDNPIYVNAGVPECIEIWNLVFIQYNRDENGELHELPAKHVDTGMGFERVCAVLQNKKSNYDTDVFTPLLNAVSKLAGIPYEKEDDKVAMRVISDHIRTLCFAIADGAVPGNDGRGYVLRRILRRAARYGRKLNLNEPFLYKLVEVVSDSMGQVFPEIVEKRSYVEKVIKGEEESFNTTLDRGIELFDKIVKKLESSGKVMIPGEDVFKLYDTFGFPVDLTNVMAKERGLQIDEIGFEVLMGKQKEKGRKSSEDKFVSQNVNFENLSSFELADNIGDVEFTGYENTCNDAVIIGYKKIEGNELVILNKTPFYVESGGQVDDLGTITLNGIALNVVDVLKIENKPTHVIENPDNVKIKLGDKVTVAIDEVRRLDIMKNHSATHLLHKALRTVLGNHVHQAGSYVGPDRLRFDFTHYSKLTDDEIKQIEEIVNDKVKRNIKLNHHKGIPFEVAKNMGALMFFGDKYGDKVNVVQFDDYSMEFCGGTHVMSTGLIGGFKIISESSISSGVRRIEAVTGSGILEYIEQQKQHLSHVEERFNNLFEEKKKLEKELHELHFKSKVGQIKSVIENPHQLKDINIYKAVIESENMDELKSYGDELRSKMKKGVGVLISLNDSKVNIISVVTDDLIKDKKLSAGKIVGDIAKILGGGGGGRPHLATAGGKDVGKVDEALSRVEEIISKYL
ncbi:MAG TPA: alanine--tRNA ligase [Ignavibacteriaceae bacterium]|nr:alanine--tRNA ligase [Ignavibacteriaceae bacterium]